jgi:hypothetical protein
MPVFESKTHGVVWVLLFPLMVVGSAFVLAAYPLILVGCVVLAALGLWKPSPPQKF